VLKLHLDKINTIHGVLVIVNILIL